MHAGFWREAKNQMLEFTYSAAPKRVLQSRMFNTFRIYSLSTFSKNESTDFLSLASVVISSENQLSWLNICPAQTEMHDWSRSLSNGLPLVYVGEKNSALSHVNSTLPSSLRLPSWLPSHVILANWFILLLPGWRSFSQNHYILKTLL